MAYSADHEVTLSAEFITASLQRARQVLAGPHVCELCDDEVTATSYCFECAVKVCAACCDHHRRLPAIREHRLEDLNTLTPLALSEHFQSCCRNHPEREAEVYCTSHQEVVCWECATIHHRSCPEVRPIPGAAEESEAAANEMRTQLFQLAQTVRAREAALTTQIHSRQNDFNQQRDRVKEVFDDLEQQLMERRRELCGEIDEQESADAHLEDLHASVESHVAMMERMLRVPSDGLMLQMMQQLEPRSKDLEDKCMRADSLQAPAQATVELDGQRIAFITAALSSLGDFGEEGQGATASSTPPVTVPSTESNATPDSAATGAAASTPTTTSTTPTTPKPTGPALARVLKVGDRGDPGQGTVTAFPSCLAPAADASRDPRYHVDVKWDGGGEGYSQMGHNDEYDLELL